MCSTSSLIALGIALILAGSIGFWVVWKETRAERRAWRDAPDQYGADEGADR